MSGRLHLGDGKLYYLVRCDEAEAEAFELANPIVMKPPTQRVEAQGFEAFEAKPEAPRPVQIPKLMVAASKDPVFQRFVEDRYPLRAAMFTDSQIGAREIIVEACYPDGANTPQDVANARWRALFDEFRNWVVTRS
jgi:hypothetical protein